MFEKKSSIVIPIALAVVSFHRAMFFPLIVYSFTFIMNNFKNYLSVWVLCLSISLLAGGVI
jgi:hypothetical protein